MEFDGDACLVYSRKRSRTSPPRRTRTTAYAPTGAAMCCSQSHSVPFFAPSDLISIAGQIAPRSTYPQLAANLHPHPANCTGRQRSNRIPYAARSGHHVLTMCSINFGSSRGSASSKTGHPPPGSRKFPARAHFAVPGATGGDLPLQKELNLVLRTKVRPNFIVLLTRFIHLYASRPTENCNPHATSGAPCFPGFL